MSLFRSVSDTGATKSESHHLSGKSSIIALMMVDMILSSGLMTMVESTTSIN